MADPGSASPTTNLRNHLELYVETSMTTKGSQGRTPIFRDLELPLHQGPQGASEAQYHPVRPFSNGHSFGDPFISGNSTLRNLPEPSRAPKSPVNRPYVPVEATTPPDFSGLQADWEGVTGFHALDHQRLFSNPNFIPLVNPRSFGDGGQEHRPAPPTPIAAHMEDRRPASALIPRDHPLRQQVESIRECRREIEEKWRVTAKEYPQQSQGIDWPIGKAHEQDLKKICTDEFELLESIERIEEGENYEQVNLGPEMIQRCHVYEFHVKRCKNENVCHQTKSSFPCVSSDTILLSVEKESDDENEKSSNTMESGAPQPAHASASMHWGHAAFSNLPTRSAHPGMSHHSAAGASALMMPAMPGVNQDNNAGWLDTEKPRRHPEVIDLTEEEDYPSPRKPQGNESFVYQGHQASTPRIRLTATALAQKRLRSGPSPFGTSIDPKRQKLTNNHEHFDQQEDHWTGIQKFRADPAVVGRGMPENAVSSEQHEDDKDEYEDEEGEYEDEEDEEF